MKPKEIKQFIEYIKATNDECQGDLIHKEGKTQYIKLSHIPHLLKEYFAELKVNAN